MLSRSIPTRSCWALVLAFVFTALQAHAEDGTKPILSELVARDAQFENCAYFFHRSNDRHRTGQPIKSISIPRNINGTIVEVIEDVYGPARIERVTTDCVFVTRAAEAAYFTKIIGVRRDGEEQLDSDSLGFQNNTSTLGGKTRMADINPRGEGPWRNSFQEGGSSLPLSILDRERRMLSFAFGFGFAKHIHTIDKLKTENGRVRITGEMQPWLGEGGATKFDILLDQNHIVREAKLTHMDDDGNCQVEEVTTEGTQTSQSLPAVAEKGKYQRYRVIGDTGNSGLESSDGDNNPAGRRIIDSFDVTLKSTKSHLTLDEFTDLATVTRPVDAAVLGDVVTLSDGHPFALGNAPADAVEAPADAVEAPE